MSTYRLIPKDDEFLSESRILNKQLPLSNYNQSATLANIRNAYKQDYEKMRNYKRYVRSSASKRRADELKDRGDVWAEAFQVYQNEEEGFNSPKEAIKWCNKMHQLTNDNRYKQISNYLHIYL